MIFKNLNLEESMKKYIIAIAAGLAMCFAGFALASGDTFLIHRGGFVVGAAAGYAELNTVNSFTNLNNVNANVMKVSQDTGDFAWGAHMGYDHQLATTGWLSHMLLGVEMGYKYLGKSKYTNRVNAPAVFPIPAINATFKTQYKSQAIDFLLKADYYIVGGWHMFAKAGLAELYTQYQFKVSPVGAPSVTFNQHHWNMRPEYQLGTGYAFTMGPQRNMHLDVFAYYDHITTEPNAYSITDAISSGANTAVPGANMVMGGVAFSFNPFV